MLLPVYLMCVCVCVCVIDMCLTISVYTVCLGAQQRKDQQRNSLQTSTPLQ